MSNSADPAVTNSTTAPASPEIFLSYPRARQDLAKRMVNDLEQQHHFSFWCDWTHIQPADAWQDELGEGIAGCKLVVFLETVGSTGNSVCRNELQYARDRGKEILRVRLEETSGFSLINDLQYEDCLLKWQDTDSYNKGILALAEEIRRLLDGGKVQRRLFVADSTRLAQQHMQAFGEERRQRFFGRDWLFSQVDTCLMNRTSQTLLVTGGPGTGKSAFVAEFVRRNPKGKVIAFHHCLDSDINTLAPAPFLGSIIKMACDRLPEFRQQMDTPDMRLAASQESCEKNPGDVFDCAVLQALRNIARPANDSPYLILIDGLDECWDRKQRDAFPNGTVLDLIASHPNLPDSAAFLLTCRPKEEVIQLLHPLNPMMEELDVEKHGETLTDVAGYIRLRIESEILAARRPDDPPAEEIAGIISAAACDNFLYAKTVLDQLQIGVAGPDNKRVQAFDSLKTLPPTLKGYYRQFFDRQFPLKAADENWPLAKRMLEVILTAREPLPCEDIASAAAVDPARGAEVLAALRPFLPCGPGERIEIFHKSFSDWLMAGVSDGSNPYRIDPQAGQIALANLAVSQFKQGKLSPYIIRFGVEHLLRTAHFGKAVDLAYSLRQQRDRLKGLDNLTLQRLSKLISVYLESLNEDTAEMPEEAVDPAKLSDLLEDFYEIEPLYGGMKVLYLQHLRATSSAADPWAGIVKRFLASDDYVIRYTLSDVIADAYLKNGRPAAIWNETLGFFNGDNINGRELAAYILRRVYATDPSCVVPEHLTQMSKSPTYPARSALGDLLLNLALQDSLNTALRGRDGTPVELSKDFWDPIWDFCKLDIWDLEAIRARNAGEPLSDTAAAEVKDAYQALLATDAAAQRTIEALGSPAGNKPFENVCELLGGFNSLGCDPEHIRDFDDDLRALGYVKLQQAMRVLFAHPLWAVAEAAATVLSGMAEDCPEALQIIAEFTSPSTPVHWKIRYGAIEAAFSARSLATRNTLFEDAVHNFHADGNCRLRALCAENLTAMILCCSRNDRRLKVNAFRNEIGCWLKDDDCWVLEHVYRLFKDLAKNGPDVEPFFKGPISPLLETAGPQRFYELSREEFLVHIEEVKRSLVGRSAAPISASA